MPFFFYSIFLFMPSVICAVQFNLHPTNASDQEAMLGVMSAITSYDPSRSSSPKWNPNVSVCEWTGIICNRRTQRVISLSVRDMGLTGTISPLLSNLSFLTILDFSNNSFHGHIPYQLGSLFRLKMLLLSLNQLEGSIPPTLAACRSLRNFSLSSNHLNGNIPSELCVFPNLQYIHLGSNNLTGTIPACLGNISSLDYINLNSNNLHGSVPSELGLLSLLSMINLWNNSLTGHIPSSFSNCTSLRQLTLAGNQLSGHIPAELCSRNTRLKELYLFRNHLSGSIPVSLFNCTELQVIELGRNQLSGVVPMEFGKLTQLQHLYLHNNKLVSGSTTSLPVLTALTNCSSLQTIALSSNRLTGRLPFSIGQLSVKMDIIYLGNNDLAGEIPPQIGNLTNLMLLESEANFLTGAIPSSLNRLQKLERIYLGSNNLQENIPIEIGQLNSLGLLDLRRNNLSGRIPDSLAHLQQLRYLDLSQNQLSGNISANLGECVKLEQLDLSYNSLTGHIPPQVADLLKIDLYLNLSNNLLQGPVPSELGKMTMVQAIDISANRLTGDIPSALESCEALEYLNLSHNILEGPIPASLGELPNLQDIDFSFNNLLGGIPMSLENPKMLSHLNFSFNKLEGEVPELGVFKKLGATAFMGNVGLCGRWVSLPPCSASESPMEKVLIPVVAVTAFVVWCLFLGIWWRKHCWRPAAGFLEVGHRNVSLGELMTATDGFNEANLLGVGGFGKVYRGVLNDGTNVAIKLLNFENEGANKSFYKEYNVLRRVRHRNLIKIITSYSDLHIKALIFPLMPNGSLGKWLYPDGEEESGLSLLQRLNIAIDIAQGMAYLHHYCFMQVIHCDLKPNNVLLDEDMTAHLIDFGIASICCANSDDSSSTCTQLKGSIGYIPPEYGLGGRVTTKGDVYSYGIVLLEMLTRKKPTHDMFVNGVNLQKWVSSNLPNQVREVVDRSLLRSTSGTFITEEDREANCLIQLLSVGLICTRESLHERPSMMEIVLRLQTIKGTFLEVVGTTNFEAGVDSYETGVDSEADVDSEAAGVDSEADASTPPNSMSTTTHNTINGTFLEVVGTTNFEARVDSEEGVDSEAAAVDSEAGVDSEADVDSAAAGVDSEADVSTPPNSTSTTTHNTNQTQNSSTS